jgi:hypothetical protein
LARVDPAYFGSRRFLFRSQWTKEQIHPVNRSLKLHILAALLATAATHAQDTEFDYKELFDRVAEKVEWPTPIPLPHPIALSSTLNLNSVEWEDGRAMFVGEQPRSARFILQTRPANVAEISKAETLGDLLAAISGSNDAKDQWRILADLHSESTLASGQDIAAILPIFVSYMDNGNLCFLSAVTMLAPSATKVDPLMRKLNGVAFQLRMLNDALPSTFDRLEVPVTRQVPE